MNAELLAEVLAHPDDDAPRMVLADWLTERGDPRGELIAVQCALAHASDAPAERATRQALEMRERDLLREHGARWITDYGLDPGRITPTRPHDAIDRARGATLAFRRGFPDELKTTMADFVAAGDAFTRAMLRRLVLTDGRVEDSLAETPPIPTLARLRLRDCFLPHARLAALAASPFLAGISELAMRRCTSDDAGALGAGELPALRTLEIDECRIDTSIASRPPLGSRRSRRCASSRPTARLLSASCSHLAAGASSRRW